MDKRDAEHAVESERKTVTFAIRGQGPLEAPAALFANFLAVSHAGSEVQFEFIFLDLNDIAQAAAQQAQNQKTATVEMKGKTVAKVIVPVQAFVQLREHLNGMFNRLEEATDVSTEKENATEGRRVASRQ